MGLERQRAVGAAVALLGVLLAAPSVFEPTWHLTVSDREHGALLSEQWQWSWGRSRLVGVAGVELQDVWNAYGLTVFVILLGGALAAAGLWAAGPRWALLAGPVGVALLAGRLLTTTADRVGRDVREDVYGGSGLLMVTDTPMAGMLETAATFVLLAALALMAYTLLRGDPAAHPAWVRTPWWGRRHTSASTAGAVARGDADAGSRVSVSLRPDGEHLSGAPVGFGDSAGRGDSSGRGGSAGHGGTGDETAPATRRPGHD